MIFAVDDDQEVLATLDAILKQTGYTVRTFDSAAKALAAAANEDPQLIISDVMMPDMGGFEFRAAYQRNYPMRQTPFVFLSSRNDAETIVQGLDSGADDYLLKPPHPEILKAKIRSIIQRRHQCVAPAFHGDLGKFPLVKIMQFCETRGLTGRVEIPIGKRTAMLRFTGGQIEFSESAEESDILDELYGLEEGLFSIYPTQVDFTSLASVAAQPPAPAVLPEVEKPMGILSGVRIGQRLFQIQTEFVTLPENHLLSLVILDGKVMMKKSTPTTATDRVTLTRQLEIQHQQVENEVREKALERSRSKKAEEEDPREKFNRLLEEGFEAYRKKEYSMALVSWEEAYVIDPANKTLSTNLNIVRKKIAA